jgi:MFS family permease
MLVSRGMPSTAFRESIQLLRTPRFGTFCVASLLSNIGTCAQQVAQPWLLLSLGASSFIVGLDTFALGAPIWLLTIAGGVLADRADRRLVIAGFQSIQMLCPMLLVGLLLSGMVRPWMVVVISLVVGITDALSMPSFQTIVPSIVPHDRISAGLALNATQFNLSRILGPGLAGMLLVSIGAIGCFAINAVSYVPFIAVALWILPRAVAGRVRVSPPGGQPLLDGVRSVLRASSLRGAVLTVFATSLLCGPLIIFCPVLVRDVYHGDAAHFSIAVAAFGVGGLVGAIGLLAVDSRSDRRRLSSWLAAGYGVVTVLAALSPWFFGLAALLVLAGIAMAVSNTSANTVAQSISPPGLRGETVSLYMLAVRGGTSLGGLVTGATIGWLGVRHALLLNGALAVVAQLVIGQRWLRGRVDDLDPHPATVVP